MSQQISVKAALSILNSQGMVPPGLGWAIDTQFGQINPFNSTGTVLVPANISGVVVATAPNSTSPTTINTATAHNFVTNDIVTIANATGNTAINGTWTITVTSATSFTIPVAGNGSYVSGGVCSTANGVAIPLGQVTSPHWSWVANLDATNYVQLKTGQAGTAYGRLLAGEAAVVPHDPTLVPWALANTSSVYLQYGILQL